MKNLNLVRCDASIDSSGHIVVGTAKTGCRQYTEIKPGTSVDGDYAYLLTNDAGKWEAGVVTVASGAAGAKVPKTWDAVQGTFANGTSALTLSCPHIAENSPAIAPGSLAPEAGLNYDLAMGSAASAMFGNSVAIGSGANAHAASTTVLGAGGIAMTPGEVALAMGYRTHSRMARLTGYVDGSTPGDQFRAYVDGSVFAPATTYSAVSSGGLMRVRAYVVMYNSYVGALSAANCWAMTIDYAIMVSGGASTTLYTSKTDLAKVGTFTSINVAVDSAGGLTMTGGTATRSVDASAFVYIDDYATNTGDNTGFPGFSGGGGV